MTRPTAFDEEKQHASYGPMGSLEGDDIASSVPRRILVVDDNPDAAQALALLIGCEGHEVQTAYDGRSALELAETFKPELMLLDIGLPKLNGYEVARCVRERPWATRLTLVAISGWGEPEDKQRASGAGFAAYLVKPVDPAEVHAVINGLSRAGHD